MYGVKSFKIFILWLFWMKLIFVSLQAQQTLIIEFTKVYDQIQNMIYSVIRLFVAIPVENVAMGLYVSVTMFLFDFCGSNNCNGKPLWWQNFCSDIFKVHKNAVFASQKNSHTFAFFLFIKKGHVSHLGGEGPVTIITYGSVHGFCFEGLHRRLFIVTHFQTFCDDFGAAFKNVFYDSYYFNFV